MKKNKKLALSLILLANANAYAEVENGGDNDRSKRQQFPCLLNADEADPPFQQGGSDRGNFY